MLPPAHQSDARGLYAMCIARLPLFDTKACGAQLQKGIRETCTLAGGVVVPRSSALTSHLALRQKALMHADDSVPNGSTPFV